MKKWFALLVVFSLFNTNMVVAQLPGKAPSSLNKSNSDPFAQPQQATPTDKEKDKPFKLPQQKLTKTFITPHTLPGIVGLAEGKWIGSDHLYNLKPNVSIYVELIQPENNNYKINEQALKQIVEAIFAKGMISSPAIHEQDEPSLPLFHVLITINNIDKLMLANVDARLFEAVDPKRVILDPGITFQAITWEKQELIAAPDNEFENTLKQTVADLTAAFVERFNYFQNVRTRVGG